MRGIVVSRPKATGEYICRMPCSRAVEKRHFDAFGRLQVVDIFEEAVQGITTVDASVSAEAALCMRDGEMACD